MDTLTAEAVPDTAAWLPPYGRLRCHYSLPRGRHLPQWPGSAWRGAFGWALRELVCLTGQSDCRGCLLAADCTYQWLFESARQGGGGRRSSHLPHPFVLTAGVPARDGGALLELCLMGPALEALPAVITALGRAGEAGVGGVRSLRLRLAEQWAAGCWQPVYRPGESLRRLPPLNDTPPFPGGRVHIRLSSPLRLVHGGALVGPDALRPGIFMRALYARMRSLAGHYGRPVEGFWPAVPDELRFPSARLRWLELERFSSRQRRKHFIGGLLGEFELDLEGLEAAWPVLWHGQYLQVGKATSQGHGAYRILTTPETR